MAQSAMKSYKGRGIVLHTLKYGENAMIVHLLTDVGGRQSFIVSGIRSGRGRGSKAALFQPLFTVEFEALSSQRYELHRFKEVRSGMTLSRTPFDLRRSTIALFIAEVLYRLVKESEANERLFNHVWHSIEALDSIETGVANFHLWFLTTLSRDLGFMPSKSYNEGYWFDICEGEYVAQRPSHKIVLEPSQAALLDRFSHTPLTELDTIPLNRASRASYLESLLQYYSYHLDATHTIRSIDILRELF